MYSHTVESCDQNRDPFVNAKILLLLPLTKKKLAEQNYNLAYGNNKSYYKEFP